MRGRIGAGLLASVAGVTVLGACLGATQIVLDVRTDVPCHRASTWKGVSISVGQPGVDVESRAPVLTTTACGASGEVGSLVVVPTGSNSATVGIRVVAGITRDPESCAAAGYDGCIVSRRTVTFLPHQSQQVIVDLTSSCIGQGCDLNHTCVIGQCTDPQTASPLVSPDGGVLGPSVRCGDEGTRCPVNDPASVCCVTFDLDAGTGHGACKAPQDCPSTSAVLHCDDPVDCVGSPASGDASDPLVCCGSVTTDLSRLTSSICTPLSSCLLGGKGGVQDAICQDRGACPSSAPNCIQATDAPGYYRCN